MEAGNCSGCGACTLLAPSLQMHLDINGFSRPVPVEIGPRPVHDDAVLAPFDRVCPGRQVSAQSPPGARRHAILGPILEVWEAWACDPEIRFAGSSGGVLTALSAWLVASRQVAQVVGSRGLPGDPIATAATAVRSRQDALEASGSRYAPVSNAAHPSTLDPQGGFVGKPCEVSAVRRILDTGPADQPRPLLMSFFCAGVPSQHATVSLVRKLGVAAEEELCSLRYRGNGWPGRFTATTLSNRAASASYEQSWGDHLGPAVQWRCKICPDGVGESADIAAGDYWRTDERGYPNFTDAPGVSVLIARTQRGRDLIEAAVAAGVLAVRTIEADSVAAVQPLQTKRRSTLAGRIVGSLLAGRPVPRYTGFSLLRLSLSNARQTLRSGRGTFRRCRAWRSSRRRG